MKQSHNDNFITTNQDYGSFYFGRLQHGEINRDEIISELAINDQVRNERRQLPSIAYNIMFNKHNLFEIVAHNKKTSQVRIDPKNILYIVGSFNQPVTSQSQLKYMKSRNKTNEEREMIIKNAVESYISFNKCIYANKSEKNPQLSNGMLGLIANELFLLNPEISADELAENMIAITVPHEYLGMSAINPTKPYPGTETDCTKTPHLQRLLDYLETVKTTINDSKQQFNSESINSQQLEGIRYIYNPFTNSIPFRQI